VNGHEPRNPFRIYATDEGDAAELQGLSLDEAFLDVTGSIATLGAPEHIAAEIKRLIRERTELTASVGVAPNKLVAKIASDLRKPDGLVHVRPGEVCELPADTRLLKSLDEYEGYTSTAQQLIERGEDLPGREGWTLRAGGAGAPPSD